MMHVRKTLHNLPLMSLPSVKVAVRSRYALDVVLHYIYSLASLFRRDFVVVDVRWQKMNWYRFGLLEATFPVSTAKNGTGEVEGSEKTPRGWHYVCARFGDGEPLDMHFKGRRKVGLLLDLPDVQDPILGRILWLSGLQFLNSTTRKRYIYVHGTTSERMQNKPLSHGCVNMFAHDIARLFSGTRQGLWVYVFDVEHLLPGQWSWHRYYFLLRSIAFACVFWQLVRAASHVSAVWF